MKPNSKNQIALGYEHSAPSLGKIGLQPYESQNIRLSAALCAMGFALRDDAQPALPIVSKNTGQHIVTFFHRPILPPESELAKQLPRLTAAMIGLWWSAVRPDGRRLSVPGYDDALLAMRHVFEAREWLIKVIKGAVRLNEGDGRKIRGSVATESLHIASAIKACGVPLITFRQSTFVFGPKAAPIAAAIADAENRVIPSGVEGPRDATPAVTPRDSSTSPKGSAQNDRSRPVTDEGVDRCIDWMLAALKYRDWLGRIVRQPDCVPMIELRDGDCFMRVRADMPKTLRRDFIRKWR